MSYSQWFDGNKSGHRKVGCCVSVKAYQKDNLKEWPNILGPIFQVRNVGVNPREIIEHRINALCANSQGYPEP